MTGSLRKLTAILAADVAGYSRLMGADEEGTLNRLKSHRRELIDPKIAEHRGRIVKTTGDGMLVEFASVVDAIKCAVEIQRAMRERETELPEDQLIQFRIGVNLGDVIIDGDDIHGDGVNVAARLEALAEPGAICVSGGAWDQVRGKVQISADDLGEKQLKNIERPVRVYRISPDPGPSERPALALPDKPSIAVLPFQNMSGDPEQEYFSDGMVEEIITALSRFHWFFVIARNSSFTYKGRAVDVKQVARELGVRYVLEGSVRKAGQKVRITGQLIDAATGAHLWAEKFEGTLDDVFALQDQVTASVAGILGPRLQQAEIDRVRRTPTLNLGAYELYLMGQSHLYRQTAEDCRRAYALGKQASDIDPTFASTWALMAACHHQSFARFFGSFEGDSSAECVRLVRLALNCDPSDPEIQALAGGLLGFHERDLAAGLALTGKAIIHNPNSARAHAWGGWVFIYAGDTVQARARFRQAIRLSPVDPYIGTFRCGVGVSYFLERNLIEAHPLLESALQENEFPTTYRFLAATLAHLGRLDEAHGVIKRLLLIQPNSTIAHAGRPYQNKDQVSLLHDGLRKAGLPE